MNKTDVLSGTAPVLCSGGYAHHYYWGCSVCGSEVGGFIITGSGVNDWATHQDKFCKECGQKVDWSNTSWNAIYKF